MTLWKKIITRLTLSNEVAKFLELLENLVILKLDEDVIQPSFWELLDDTPKPSFGLGTKKTILIEKNRISLNQVY